MVKCKSAADQLTVPQIITFIVTLYELIENFPANSFQNRFQPPISLLVIHSGGEDEP